MKTMTNEPHVRREHPRPVRSNRNVGGWERAARMFLGAAALGAALTAGPIWLRVILAIAGATGLLTSVGAYCPINRALGRDTYHHGDLE
jgi:hypothetical protein